jgi:hypothetical protein
VKQAKDQKLGAAVAEDPKIVRVELPVQSLQTYRELFDGHAALYIVFLWLSAPIDDYVRFYLTKFQIGLEFDNEQPTKVIMRNTTLERVRQQMPALNKSLEVSAQEGRRLKEAAEAEDERLTTLVDEINAELQPD